MYKLYKDAYNRIYMYIIQAAMTCTCIKQSIRHVMNVEGMWVVNDFVSLCCSGCGSSLLLCTAMPAAIHSNEQGPTPAGPLLDHAGLLCC